MQMGRVCTRKYFVPGIVLFFCPLFYFFSFICLLIYLQEKRNGILSFSMQLGLVELHFFLLVNEAIIK